MKNKKQTIKDKIQRSEKTYAKKWDNSSDFIREQKGYIWMADFAKGYEKILEIGCGNGNSTLELAKRGHKIVCIEENANCIEITSKKLQQSGINFKCIRRGTFIDRGSNYNIKYNGFIKEYDPSIQVYIVEGNILSFGSKEDTTLFKWLFDVAPFDGVICWLIGTHELALQNSLLHKHVSLTKNFALYRNTIQFLVAHIKDSLVCENGFIHFVDRVLDENLNSVLTADFKENFSQDLSLPISKCKVDTMHIGNLVIDGGVAMGKLNVDTNKPVKFQESDVHLFSMFYKF